MCLADVLWPQVCPDAPQAPAQIWGNVGLEEGGLGAREGPSKKEGYSAPASSILSAASDGFDAIPCKLVIKRLQEALQKTSGIDIAEANFTSGAVAVQ